MAQIAVEAGMLKIMMSREHTKDPQPDPNPPGLTLHSLFQSDFR